MNAIKATLATIAAEAGVSKMTVSVALRGKPGCSARSRRRIVEIARRVGYVANPVVSAVMAEVRGPIRRTLANLALISPPLIDATDQLVYRAVQMSAAQEADRLGYGLTELRLEGSIASSARISTILKARGIRGAILKGYRAPHPGFSLEWERCAWVAIGRCLDAPDLHRLAPDNYQMIKLCLKQLRARGVRRVGLAVRITGPYRTARRWLGACLGQPAMEDRDFHFIPPWQDEWTGNNFMRWLRTTRPEAILALNDEPLVWLKNHQIAIPDEISFVHLGLPSSAFACAGIDPHHDYLGSTAVSVLDRMLRHNEFGVPPIPTTITVPGQWVDGPTVRNLACNPPR